MSILDSIHSRADLLGLDPQQTDALCAELRTKLVETISHTGGHLSSNLGIVELTVAIHKVFDTARDRLVFDVGHQCYVHKLLTGRAAQFDTLRQYGGLCGFPNPEESCHDAAIAGHASNSISVALGMALARSCRGEDYSVLALIGDGAMTGGLSFEGLANAGASGEPLIVILNDNEMSISPNVGAFARYLRRVRTKKQYFRIKSIYRKATKKLPGGKHLYRLTHNLKAWMRNALLGTNWFESLGFTYLGPCDGHNVARLTELLTLARDQHCPVLLHVKTVKGKGYGPAERVPSLYHGVSSFDAKTGETPRPSDSFSMVFGHLLTQLAAERREVCAITAAMESGTGLTPFAESYPKRFYDVGIAEGHAVAMAAGLAAQGMVPVVAIYSTFLQRAYDMILHDVAISHQHVVFAVDRAGLVGDDGQTHHGAFDVGYLRQIPGMQILCPVHYEELREMLRRAVVELDGPVAIRYPRGRELELIALPEQEQPELCFITYSEMTAPVQNAVLALRQEGIRATMLRLTQISPLDEAAIRRAAACGLVLVVEDCVQTGSVGEAIAAMLSGSTCRVICCNHGERFVTHGKVQQLYATLHLDQNGLIARAKEALHHGEGTA